MKSYTETSDGSGASSCIAMLLIGLLFAAIGAVCWPYTINSWLEYAGKPPCIAWWCQAQARRQCARRMAAKPNTAAAPRASPIMIEPPACNDAVPVLHRIALDHEET